jgi:hypothetical protein
MVDTCGAWKHLLNRIIRHGSLYLAIIQALVMAKPERHMPAVRGRLGHAETGFFRIT